MATIKELAEQAGLLGPTSRVGNAHEAAERFAELIEQWARADERDKCAQDYLQNCADAIDAARVEERKSMNSILDQALKDQKDAERYMHLKWVITGNALEKQMLIDKADDQIDQLMDERIRSYDE